MKPYRRLLAVFAIFVFPLLASAHPGHDHSDIPSVIRHPFAGVDHVAITAAVFLITGATMLVSARLFSAARSVRWIGATCAVAGVVLTLI
jgi:hypothetical protein